VNYISDELALQLEGCSDGVKALLQRKVKGNHCSENYNEELRAFALTLNVYSPRAYEYVRKSSDNCLLHSKTISKWYRSVNAEPGFSEEGLSALKRKVEIKW